MSEPTAVIPATSAAQRLVSIGRRGAVSFALLLIGALVGYSISPVLVLSRTLPRWPIVSILLCGIALVGLPMCVWRVQRLLDPQSNHMTPSPVRIAFWCLLAVLLGTTLSIVNTREAIAEKPAGNPCIAATQDCLYAETISGSVSCTVPRDVIITRYQLNLTFSQGGDVELDGKTLASIAPTDIGYSRESLVNISLEPGDHFHLRVVARGSPSMTRPNYARAQLQLYGVDKRR